MYGNGTKKDLGRYKALQYKPFSIPLRIEKICLMIQCYSHVSSKHQTASSSDVIFFLLESQQGGNQILIYMSNVPIIKT